MSITKNDCMDCANSTKKSWLRDDWTCTNGHVIPKNKKGWV